MKKIFSALFCFILIAGIATLFAPLLHADSQSAQEAKLQQELVAEQALLDQLNAQLGSLKQESASYSRDLAIITTEIKAAQANIKAKTTAIAALGKQINQKLATIQTLDNRIGSGKESLSALIKRTNELDSSNIVEMMLADKNLTDYFQDQDSFGAIQESMQTLFADIRDTKGKTQAERDALKAQQDKELDAKAAIEASERQIAVKQGEAKQVLSDSQNKVAYQASVVATHQAKVNAIKAALFHLRDSAGISFGDAYAFAQLAEKQTGIRPAFLLAILTQESNLGQNVGTCNRPGDPPEKQWQAVMKPTRDQAPFLAITSSLGIDPATQPVSCPWGGGYGGAMGPAQFIPSTWMLFKDRIAAATGDNPPSPWAPKDAFMASALYLTDLGAGSQVYSAERNAACKYYSGRSCDSAAPANSFYGDQVIAKATAIQETQIDVIENK